MVGSLPVDSGELPPNSSSGGESFTGTNSCPTGQRRPNSDRCSRSNRSDSLAVMEMVVVRSVEYLGGRVLRVEFTDGVRRDLRFRVGLDGVLASLDDDQFLARATVDPVSETLTWQGGIDRDPLVLRGIENPVGVEVFDLVAESDPLGA